MKNKKKTVNPASKQILIELEEVVERLGFKARYEKGNFEGGYCVLKDSRLIVVNSRNEVERRISIVAKCIKEIGIDDIFVKPHLREIIETESVKVPFAENNTDESTDEEEENDDEGIEKEIHETKT